MVYILFSRNIFFKTTDIVQEMHSILFRFWTIYILCSIKCINGESNSWLCDVEVPITYNIKAITAPEGLLFESPQWSSEENVLYWVDKLKQKIYRLDPYFDDLSVRDIGFGQTSLVIPVKDSPGTILVAVRNGLHFLKWGAPGGDMALRQLTVVDLGKPDNYINDGKVDDTGRLWFGTQGKLFGFDAIPDQATLYSINYKNFINPEIKLRPVSLSNGIAWSLDNKQIFYNDSPTRTIQRFDFILKTGEIGNRTILFDFNNDGIPGMPDGMTIDIDGNLWVATFMGGRILKIDSSSGVLLDQVFLPADQVSSVIWGGKDFATLYVTTGKHLVDDPQPLSGSVFAITDTGTRGKPEPMFLFPGASKY